MEAEEPWEEATCLSTVRGKPCHLPTALELTWKWAGAINVPSDDLWPEMFLRRHPDSDRAPELVPIMANLAQGSVGALAQLQVKTHSLP